MADGSRVASSGWLETLGLSSAYIAKVLGERSFKLFPGVVSSIHQRLFEGVYSFAGQYRKVDISKKEWVLRGDSVLYCTAPMIAESVTWDVEQEAKRNYMALSMPQAVEKIAEFISGLWQIHPFSEGNTRTMAVLLVKYLRYMGVEIDNAPFARHSWYFRNALVRANYYSKQKGIPKDSAYLIRFLRNLLMGEDEKWQRMGEFDLREGGLVVKCADMGFTTLATAAVTAAKVLPDALQTYSFYKQSKALRHVAREQERLADAQADRMEDTAVANQQRAARNAESRMASARADAAASNLLAEGSVHMRETDLATRLQDDIANNTNAALDEADRTRRQGKLNAWNTRHAASQARMSALGSALSAVGSIFSGAAGTTSPQK